VLTGPSQSVKSGQIIGNLGSSGLAPYPHIHVELQSEGVIGAPTIPAYFSDYLVCHNEYDEYVSLGIPEEKQRVMSISCDSRIKALLNFEVGTVVDYKTSINGESLVETLEYDMDSQGILFIRSSACHDRFYFSVSNRSVSFYSYSGGKKSSLFFLGLGINKIPFYISDRLVWKNKVPSFDVGTNIGAFFSELVLPYTGGSFCTMEHTFFGTNEKLCLKSRIYQGDRHIGERLIVFNEGVETMTYEVKNFHLEMERETG